MIVFHAQYVNHNAHFRDAVQFCFGSLLQAELDNFAEEWNHHRIRKSSIAETISGIPELLYFVPSHYGWSDS